MNMCELKLLRQYQDFHSQAEVSNPDIKVCANVACEH